MSDSRIRTTDDRVCEFNAGVIFFIRWVYESPCFNKCFIPSWRFLLAMLSLLVPVCRKLANMAMLARIAEIDDQADSGPVKEQPDCPPAKADEQQDTACHSHGTDDPDKWRFEGTVKMGFAAAQHHYSQRHHE